MRSLNRTFLLLSLVLPGLSHAKPIDNWHVDGLNGGVTVTAALTETPCSLASESAEQHIDFGNVPYWQLAKVGDRSKAVNLHLILEHCVFTEDMRVPEHGDNLYHFPLQPVAVMRFIGEQASGDPRLFLLKGETTGVGLHLQDSQHQQVIPGERGEPQVLNPGRNDLVYEARLRRLAGDLTLGAFSAVVNLELEYR